MLRQAFDACIASRGHDTELQVQAVTWKLQQVLVHQFTLLQFCNATLTTDD